MRYKIFVLIILTLSFLESNAQMSTWVKTLFYDPGGYFPYHHDSLNVGPLGFAVRPDGKFFVLNQDYEQGQQTIYLIDSLGNIEQSISVGDWLTLQESDCYGLQPTPDSGCIYIEHYYDFGGMGPDRKSTRLNSSH